MLLCKSTVSVIQVPSCHSSFTFAFGLVLWLVILCLTPAYGKLGVLRIRDSPPFPALQYVREYVKYLDSRCFTAWCEMGSRWKFIIVRTSLESPLLVLESSSGCIEEVRVSYSVVVLALGPICRSLLAMRRLSMSVRCGIWFARFPDVNFPKYRSCIFWWRFWFPSYLRFWYAGIASLWRLWGFEGGGLYGRPARFRFRRALRGKWPIVVVWPSIGRGVRHHGFLTISAWVKIRMFRRVVRFRPVVLSMEWKLVIIMYLLLPSSRPFCTSGPYSNTDFSSKARWWLSEHHLSEVLGLKRLSNFPEGGDLDVYVADVEC